jgi:hypothetical protein
LNAASKQSERNLAAISTQSRRIVDAIALTGCARRAHLDGLRIDSRIKSRTGSIFGSLQHIS